MIIEARDLSKTYTVGDRRIQVLDRVSLAVGPGEFLVIEGESGSGKSTLLSLLSGLDRPDSGRVIIEGRDITDLSEDDLAPLRNETFGFVFQSFHLVPYLTALENVMLPLAITKMKNRDKVAAAREALERVGLGGKADRLPNQLSGGEQERVAIARAIVKKPPIILADEPTGNLDTKTSEEVMDLFRRLNAAGHTVVMVTHNPDNCTYADRTIRLRDGLVVEDGAADATTRTAA